MNPRLEWPLWKVEQIVAELPGLIEHVEANLDKFSGEHREKNVGALASLKAALPTPAEVRDGLRSHQLVTLGYALDVLGRRGAGESSSAESLRLLRAAHELFRGGNPAVRPTTPMRQTLGNALKVLLAEEIAAAVDGRTDARVIRESLEAFINSAWGDLPPQLSLTINEMILNALERARISGENDSTFHERFVRDNIEAVLSMEIPTRLEQLRERWEEIGQHVAPAAVRMAQRTLRRPEDLSTLLGGDVWARVQKAVERGDVEALGLALAPARDKLETNLRLRLDAKAEYREPVAQLRSKGGPDTFFLEARDFLLRRDRRALEKFSDIHFRRPTNSIAKEWYAYALTVFGQSTDLYEIVTLLEDALRSERYREDLGWTARWNLACALRRLPDRAVEALDILLPVLDQDTHSPEVFELCLLWALEQNKDEVLATLLLRSSSHEAHLLAALQEAEVLADARDRSHLRDHFRRVNRILQAPDRVFPSPMEALTFRDLDQITRDFIEGSLVEAGIEWFRQRLSIGNERHVFKNWECAALLNERAGDLVAAWRCREQQWATTENRRNLDKRTKTAALRSLLTWAEKNGFGDRAVAVLKRGWRVTAMSEANARLWEERLTKSPSAVLELPVPAKEQAKPPTITLMSLRTLPEVGTTAPEEAEVVIQQLAPVFTAVGNAESLAARAGDVSRLLDATLRKHPGLSSPLIDAIREVVDISIAFTRGVNEQEAIGLAERMRACLAALRQRQDLPYELHGLAQACERVAQTVSVRARAIPDLTITLPSGLRMRLHRPSDGESYVTRLFTRIANPGPGEAGSLKVTFITASPFLRASGNAVEVGHLGPGEKRVVECPVEVLHGIGGEVEVRVHVSYEVGGVSRTMHASGRLTVAGLEGSIPVALRYVTLAPVSQDRVDLFHGRDKELADLSAVFAGGRLRRLYFVNGIRRVGKSTLMQHLGSRCGPDVLAFMFSIETLLEGQKMTTVQLVRRLIRSVIDQMRQAKGFGADIPELPPPAAFGLDPPWTVFDDFLTDIVRRTQHRNILLCFDEVQRLVACIADAEDPIDDGFLSWLRGKIQTASDVLVVCTGSEPFAQMRKRYNHTLWGNMEPYNVSFVEKAAMTKIATLPVQPDGVVWLPEAIERLWEMTEGHPWITQILAEKAVEQLNAEYRRIVGPGDIDRAADKTASDSNVSELWWNEGEGLVTATHRQIAFLILQHQLRPGFGLDETHLAEVSQSSGIRTVGKHLDEMRLLEVLTEVRETGEPRWRIRGAFLERHLATLMQRAMQEAGGAPRTDAANQPLALMLDWENVKISLSKILKEIPEQKANLLHSRLDSAELASRLLEAAARHGSPRQRWAVADWDRPFFQGDQKVFKNARYWTDIAGDQKANASDHVLLEKLHFVLREHPEIVVYVIGTGDGDFHEAIKTLQEQGKRVILWSTRNSINKAYGESLKGPDRIKIEWLEDLVFGD